MLQLGHVLADNGSTLTLVLWVEEDGEASSASWTLSSSVIRGPEGDLLVNLGDNLTPTLGLFHFEMDVNLIPRNTPLVLFVTATEGGTNHELRAGFFQLIGQVRHHAARHLIDLYRYIFAGKFTFKLMVFFADFAEIFGNFAQQR